MLPILLIVVNNVKQVVQPESSLQSGVTMLNIMSTTFNNVGSTTFFNPVFHNLLQLIIFGRVKQRGYTISKPARLKQGSCTFSKQT